jgi:uncharacterized repeat protein (TIGR01451 family)
MNNFFSSIKFSRVFRTGLMVGGLWVGASQAAIAQVAIDSITASPSLATPFTLTTTGAIGGNGGQYATTTTYTVNFGKGSDLTMSAIGVGGSTYATQQISNYIGIRRKNNTSVTGDRHILLYERLSKIGTTLNLGPSYVSSMEEILLSNVINRGADNVFTNQGDGANNNNNIERIDMITTQGVKAPSNAAKLTKVGFMILDRNGNDPFKIAAITAIDGSNNPTSIGPLISVGTGTWGASAYPVQTTVIRRDGVGAFKPSIDVGSQTIKGTFISYQTLGVAANQKIYGYALFPADVTSSMDLIGLTNVPLSTNTSDGGLDLLAGGLSFSEFPTTDLTIAKTDNQTTATSGNPIVYTITVTNNGSTALTSLKVTDTLPTALVSPTFTTTTGSYNSATGDWTGLALAPKQSIELKVSGTIAASFSGTLTNTAKVEPPIGTEDYNPDNNEATDTTDVSLSGPKLRLVKRITKVASQAVTNYVDTVEPDDNGLGWINQNQTAQISPGPGTSTNFSALLQGSTDSVNLPATIVPPKPGQEIEYTIYFLSDGGVDAKNVKLCDFIPLNNTYVPASLQLSQSGGAATAVTGTVGDFYPNGNALLTTASGPCKNGIDNGKGGIIVNVGPLPRATGSGTPIGSYGYIRFRATVQ